MTIIEKLAAFATGANAQALPEPEQVLLHRHLLDTLVAAAAAGRTGEGRSLAALLDARGLPDLIGRRAAGIRLSEIDDIHLGSCTTPSAAAVACALSLAGQAGACDPVRVASAIWVGTELATVARKQQRCADIPGRGAARRRRLRSAATAAAQAA